MSDPKTTETETQTTTTTDTPEHEGAPQTKGVFANLREVGETGKRQWEDTLARLKTGYDRAQGRGAGLLLRAVSAARGSLQTWEASLQQTQANVADEASEQAPVVHEDHVAVAQ
jgi:hypothetical protein